MKKFFLIFAMLISIVSGAWSSTITWGPSGTGDDNCNVNYVGLQVDQACKLKSIQIQIGDNTGTTTTTKTSATYMVLSTATSPSSVSSSNNVIGYSINQPGEASCTGQLFTYNFNSLELAAGTYYIYFTTSSNSVSSSTLTTQRLRLIKNTTYTPGMYWLNSKHTDYSPIFTATAEVEGSDPDPDPDDTYTINSTNGTVGHGDCSNTSSEYNCKWTSSKTDPATLTLDLIYDDVNTTTSGGYTYGNNMLLNSDGSITAYSANSCSNTYTQNYVFSLNNDSYFVKSYSFDYAKSKTAATTVLDNDGNAYTSGTVCTNSTEADSFKFSIKGATSTIDFITITNLKVIVAKKSETPEPEPTTPTYKENTSLTLFDNPASSDGYYRIPAIAKLQNGDLLALTDLRVDGSGDVGTGSSISIVGKTSSDNGETWGSQFTAVEGGGSGFDKAHGDAAVVADSETGKLILLAASGEKGYGSGGVQLGQYYSSDNGSTWTGSEITSAVKSAFTAAGLSVSKQFFTSGRIIQSSKVKVGTNYRIYSAMCTGNGSIVMYSDDFGANWAVLGSQVAYSGGDETVLEELPNGDLLLSARLSGSGRGFNVFSYTSTSTGAGSWNSSTATGLSDATSANGEMLLLSTKETGKYVLLHSVALSGRTNVTVYYKTIDTTSDAYTTPSFYSTGWSVLKQMSTTTSCYSTMVQDKNGNVAFLFEENGTDGYDIQYRNFTVSETVAPTPTTYYTVTCNTAQNGKVTASTTSAAAGATVTLTVTPDSGYELETLTVATAETTKQSANTYTFTMPASDVIVTATFKESETPSGVTTYTIDKTKVDCSRFDDTEYTGSNSFYKWTTKSDSRVTMISHKSSDFDTESSAEDMINNMNWYGNNLRVYGGKNGTGAAEGTTYYKIAVADGYKIDKFKFTATLNNATVKIGDLAYTSGEYQTVGASEVVFTVTSDSGTSDPWYALLTEFNIVVSPNSSTGIDDIKAANVNSTAGTCYNLAGQRVGKDAKGIIIVNGKKVIR